jgi:hypothetical protein
MEDSTPSRSSASTSVHNADFTRPPDPTSPLNFRAAKRYKDKEQGHTVPPPILKTGASTTNRLTAEKTIYSQLDEDERKAKVKREVLGSLATTIDKFVASCKQPEHRALAHNICDKFIGFVSTSDFAENNGADYYPIRVRSHPTTPTSSGSRVTWADIAATPKSSGVTPGTKTLHAKNDRPATSDKSARSRSTLTSEQREDRRILITLTPQALLRRAEPYAVRQALCACIEGLNSTASIPKIEPTRTGWAITPANIGIRDLLTTDEAARAICVALDATSVKLPERWFNYAVPGVPSSLPSYDGSSLLTSELIEDEVKAQAKTTPVNCRPSRYGANPETGRTTWIISFRTPVRAFSLFNASEKSRLIDKKAPITRHDPGCQGYCHPPRCTRVPRCNNCGKRTDEHDGPTGENCTKKAQCANCQGPFPAGHDNCPAVPKRKNGKLVRLTKKELTAVRRYGLQCYQDTNTQREETTAEPQVDLVPTTKSKKRAAPDVAEGDTSSHTKAAQEQGRQQVPSRPQRSTAYRGTHNETELWRQSSQGSGSQSQSESQAGSPQQEDSSSSSTPGGGMEIELYNDNSRW